MKLMYIVGQNMLNDNREPLYKYNFRIKVHLSAILGNHGLQRADGKTAKDFRDLQEESESLGPKIDN